MSKIGKQPINIPQGVTVTISETDIAVKGPKGNLQMAKPEGVTVEQIEQQIIVKRFDDLARSKAMHGLTRALLNNLVVGVTEGFTKVLEIQGVGYRATLDGEVLRLDLGYSHPIFYPFPEGIDIQVGKNNVVTISGMSKERVGQTAAEIRAFRPPEPYKGKGVRYSGEFVRIKEGKRNA